MSMLHVGTSTIWIRCLDRDLEPFDLATAEKIGEDAFSVVYSGFVKESKSRRTGEIRCPRTEVVIKKLKKPPESLDAKKALVREVLLAKSLKFPVLLAKSLKFPTLSRVLYWDASSERGWLTISIRQRDTLKHALEMAETGNPLTWKNSEGETVTWDATKRAITAFGVAAGLCYMHERDLIHRDMKPDNILLDENMFPMISDFGLSRVLPSVEIDLAQGVETPLYMAPEVASGRYTTSADVYSYGLILYKLFTLEDPWPEGVPRTASIWSFVEKVSQGARPLISKHAYIPTEWSDLITRCGSGCPEDRPTMREVVENMKDIDFSTFDAEVGMNVVDEYRSALYEKLGPATK